MKTKFTNGVIRDGYMYGLSDGILECIEIESGDRIWKRGRYGHGQLLLVGDVLIVQAEDGRVLLVRADPEGHEELGEIHALEGLSWNTLCLVGPYLVVRNGEVAVCYELATVQSEEASD